MADQKTTEEKVFKKHDTVVDTKTDVPAIVKNYIAQVMYDTKNMQGMEHALDVYVQSLTPEEKQSKRTEITKQLTDGRKALESLLNRFLSS